VTQGGPLQGRISADGATVYELLRKVVAIRPEDFTALHSLPDGPFALLVAIVLSQNSNDRNSIAAYDNLKRGTGLDPRRILEIGNGLEDMIRRAGMVRQKANAIRGLARLVLERGEEFLRSGDINEVREALLSIRGIGMKTVDVYLSLYRRIPRFAVDTHARRIAARWGLIRPNASYEEVSEALLNFFGPKRADEAHRLLIAFGRTYCTARSPRCSECPLRPYCPSAAASARG
jgi:endonuclease-3